MILEHLLEATVRREHGKILAGLIRRAGGGGQFDLAEEALQDAYLKAHESWSRTGIPDNAAAWLTTVAQHRLIDLMRRASRVAVNSELLLSAMESDAIGEDDASADDDLLRLVFTCCHPALTHIAATTLALRTLGGLSTKAIARAFLEPEATTAQRLVRAKQKITKAGIPFHIPLEADLPERLASVLAVIYFMFNEGYAATAHTSLLRVDLCEEAIRLGQLVARKLPQYAECHGLLALLQLHHARVRARTNADGALVPLVEQDRSLWNHDVIMQSVELLDAAVLMRQAGPYQIQAAIAALHSQAPTAEQTDWTQISFLYFALLRHQNTPVIALNAAVALAMSEGVEHGLKWIAKIEASGALQNYHLLPATKADLLRRAGRIDEAAVAYNEAINLASNVAEKTYLEKRLAYLTA